MQLIHDYFQKRHLPWYLENWKREKCIKEKRKSLWKESVSRSSVAACPWWRIGVCQYDSLSPCCHVSATREVKYADFRSWANLCWHPGAIVSRTIFPKMQLTLLKDYSSHFAFCRWRRQICRSSEMMIWASCVPYNRGASAFRPIN